MVNYIKMDKSHINDIIEIEKYSFTQGWTKNMFLEELDNPLAHYFVVKDYIRVIGYAGMWLIYEEAHITNIAIHPDNQGKGNGKQLLEYIIRYAQSKNIEKITLEVRASNERAIALYKKQGFEGSGLRKAYYADNKEDAIIMWRHLC